MEEALRTMGKHADQDAAKAALKIIHVYLMNHVAHPLDEKFLRVPKTNKAFQEKVASVPGALDLMKAVGFSEKDGAMFLEASFSECADRAQRIASAVQFGLHGSGFPAVCIVSLVWLCRLVNRVPDLIA
jgi:hypothetical protein